MIEFVSAPKILCEFSFPIRFVLETVISLPLPRSTSTFPIFIVVSGPDADPMINPPKRVIAPLVKSTCAPGAIVKVTPLGT